MVKPPGMKESGSNTAAAPVDKEEANDRQKMGRNLNGTRGLAESLQGDPSHVFTVESPPERVELRLERYEANESPEEMSMKRSSTSFTESLNDTILQMRVLITVVVGSLLVGMVYHPRAVLPLAVVVCLHPSTIKVLKNPNVISMPGAKATVGNATSICRDRCSSVPTNHRGGLPTLHPNRASQTIVALMIVLISRQPVKNLAFNPITVVWTVLWFGLIMISTMNALAIGAMFPTMALMDRRPFRWTSPPISSIRVQPVFQRVPCILKHHTCQSWIIREPNHEEDYRHHSIMSNPFGFGMVFNKLTLFKDLHSHPLFIGVFMAVFELARLVDMDAIIKTARRSPAKIGGHSMPVLIVLLLFASVGDVMANGTGVDSDGGETGEVHVCKGDFCVTAKVAILVPLGTALLVAGGFCWRRALACCSCCCRLWCWPSAAEGNIMTDTPPQQQADAQPLMQTQVSNLVTLVRILFVAFVTMLTGTRRVAPVSRAPSVGGVSLV